MNKAGESPFRTLRLRMINIKKEVMLDVIEQAWTKDFDFGLKIGQAEKIATAIWQPVEKRLGIDHQRYEVIGWMRKIQ